jgi:hypothetical protein
MPRSSRCRPLLLAAGARDSWGNERKGKVRRWMPTPSNGSKNVTVKTSCVRNIQLQNVVKCFIKVSNKFCYQSIISLHTQDSCSVPLPVKVM